MAAKQWIKSGEEFTNRVNRTKRCVFVESVLRGINNDVVDYIYHCKDLSTGKITHLRNDWFNYNKWRLTNESLNNRYSNSN